MSDLSVAGFWTLEERAFEYMDLLPRKEKKLIDLLILKKIDLLMITRND